MVDSRDERLSQFLLAVGNRPRMFTLLFAALYLFLNNTVNALSTWTEIQRGGNTTVALWEPFCWEHTSTVSTLICLLPVIVLIRLLTEANWSWTVKLMGHLAVASALAVSHITLMVLFRKIIYLLVGRNYDFGLNFSTFFYEYRKDVWGYIFAVGIYHLVTFLYRRVRGEASMISTQNEIAETDNTKTDYLLVKKLDKEFLVPINDISWIEASGNYVNLCTGDATYPFRSSMTRFCEQVATRGFMRTHRSYAVKLDHIASIEYEDSGDGIIRLKTGHSVPLSRRYKEGFRKSLTAL